MLGALLKPCLINLKVLPNGYFEGQFCNAMFLSFSFISISTVTPLYCFFLFSTLIQNGVQFNRKINSILFPSQQ